MLAARQILSENFQASPWVRRRPPEGFLVYQLMVTAEDPLDRVLGLLSEQGVEAVDLNLACNARSIRNCEAGSTLFENLEALRKVARTARRLWSGILTAKIRLGHQGPDWQPRFVERLRLLEDSGLDAVILHPRFFEDKFKRRARLELIPWAASLTRLPLIANGDLGGSQQVRAQAEHLQPASAIMIGRMAIVRPWIFATWEQAQTVDLAAIWRKMYQFVREDFPAKVALRRIQMFTKYFAANFTFGHQFNVQVSNAPSLEEVFGRAAEFFSRAPATVLYPTVSGL
jgi:tRNA-dihydrouridine synthase